MKQIVDKLNKIAKKINENVELSDRDLIIDSLDSITKAYGGTPNDSTLIVDKLDDIYNNISPAVSGNIEITENTAEGETLNIAPYATATVNVSGGGGDNVHYCTITLIPDNESEIGLDDRDSYIIENAVLMHPDSVIDSQTVLLSPHYSFIDKKGHNTITYALFYPNNATLTATNEVNCNWDSLNNCIYITDNTTNSSITLSGYTPK